MNYKEKHFEQGIESYLLQFGGYTQGNLTHYEADKALNLSELIRFIESTQPKQWERYQKIYGNNSDKNFYKRFCEEVDKNGLIDVLRNGISDRGIKLKLCYFKPESNLNQELIQKYECNLLTCTRQFRYSAENKNSIDIVLSLNGIPIIALELKNQLTGQSIEHAKQQFMNHRDPKELCFQFNKRFLVYFCVDLFEVAMTTQLAGQDTFFLPFNQGSNGAGNVGGAGNPQNIDGYSTSYLWENILSKDSLMNILHRFLHVDRKKSKIIDQDGHEKIKINQRIIFPRYHQLDVVNQLVLDVKQNGSGQNYLIQHSAGSGKSNSIAWICYRLCSLHNNQDQAIFNSVIVVTDRKVLDSQLQNTISSFDHAFGLIETIGDDKTSQDLKDAINDGKKIIVTTLQKFPVIYQEVNDNSGKRFAVIVDEAHSSQTGSSAQKLKIALADREEALKEFAEIEYDDESKHEDFEDKIVKELLSHGRHQNLSFFAFTATPKQKTLELFGQKQNDGSFRPFHIYSMKQAIEEGFIHDVLAHYMTYQVCFQIAKNTPDNPELPENQAKKAIKRFESLHHHNLNQKTIIIIEQFRSMTCKKINGQGKAMIVTASRLHAVRYYFALKTYIESKGYQNIGVLIAFSGTVKDGDNEYTESSLNQMSEKQLPNAFHNEKYNILIVADKYQTGFDEPLLHSMFVDKKLNGVKAVQTLSRLNRTTKGKVDTFVMDFVNTSDEIKDAFAPFYEETILDQEINVNLIYDTQKILRNFHFYNDSDIIKFNKIYHKNNQTTADLGQLTSLFNPILKYILKLSDDQQFLFKKTIRNFVKWYAYIIQITRMFDKSLQMEYHFLTYLEKVLPSSLENQINLDDKLTLEFYKLDQTFDGVIQLENDSSENQILKNSQTIDNTSQLDQKDQLLEQIIFQINQRFSGIFSDSDKVIVETIYEKLMLESKKLKKYAKKESTEVYQESFFPHIFKEIAQKCYTEQITAFTKLFENKDFYNVVMNEIGKETYRNFRNSETI